MIVGVLIVVLGFVLMAGGGSEDPEKFSYDIFSTRRITIAPIMVMLGYIVVMLGIMRKPKLGDNTKENNELDLDA